MDRPPAMNFHPAGPTEPPPEAYRKPRGCFFYGCITAIVLAIVAAILVALLAAFLYGKLGEFVRDYAEDAPSAIPVAELPVEDLDALKARISAFGASLDAPAEVEDKAGPAPAVKPLELSAEEINALINSDPDLKGVVAVDFADDTFRGKVALPLAKIGFPGRFLNGEATFDARVDNGLLLITIDTLEVKGKPVPEDFVSELRKQNLVKDMAKDPKQAARLGRIDRVEVKGGKLVITPKSPTAPAPEPEKPDEDEPKTPA